MLENMSKATRNVVIVLFFVLLAGVLGRVSAQDEPVPVNTGFTISCMSGDPSRIWFLMESDGVETYTLHVYGADLETNIPLAFDTQVGKVMLGWINAEGYIGAGVEVHFRNSQGFDGVMQLDYDYMTWCDHNDETPLPTPEPDATPEPTAVIPQCIATAINQANGHAYCYDPALQPQNLSGAVVPVPPPSN